MDLSCGTHILLCLQKLQLQKACKQACLPCKLFLDSANFFLSMTGICVTKSLYFIMFGFQTFHSFMHYFSRTRMSKKATFKKELFFHWNLMTLEILYPCSCSPLFHKKKKENSWCFLPFCSKNSQYIWNSEILYEKMWILHRFHRDLQVQDPTI